VPTRTPAVCSPHGGGMVLPGVHTRGRTRTHTREHAHVVFAHAERPAGTHTGKAALLGVHMCFCMHAHACAHHHAKPGTRVPSHNCVCVRMQTRAGWCRGRTWGHPRARPAGGTHVHAHT